MNINLRDMRQGDIDAIVAIIGQAMNADEGKWSRTTMERHFLARARECDDGRSYFVVEGDGMIIGITGLHFYEWGPTDMTWLGWFALHPTFQGQGLGRQMMEMICSKARERGYRRVFIETYSSPDFAKARHFYSKAGFIPAGTIARYLDRETDMIVYSKRL